MADESLKQLEIAFNRWRGTKRHISEAIPKPLIKQAERVAATHSKAAVVKVTGLAWKRIPGEPKKSKRLSDKAEPAYSRIEISAPPSAGSHPVAEIETPTGFKLRVFAITPETTGLLSSFYRAGGSA